VRSANVVLGYPFGTTTSTPTKMAHDMKGHPDSRSCHKTTPDLQLSATSAWPSVSTSGQEIT
jgi:hypothetical protein